MSPYKVWRFADKNVEKETVGLFEKFRPFLEIITRTLFCHNSIGGVLIQKGLAILAELWAGGD